MGKASCEHIIPAEAEVMFEYIAVEDDELTLKVGDVITDIKKVRALLKEFSLILLICRVMKAGMRGSFEDVEGFSLITLFRFVQ